MPKESTPDDKFLEELKFSPDKIIERNSFAFALFEIFSKCQSKPWFRDKAHSSEEKYIFFKEEFPKIDWETYGWDPENPLVLDDTLATIHYMRALVKNEASVCCRRMKGIHINKKGQILERWKVAWPLIDSVESVPCQKHKPSDAEVPPQGTPEQTDDACSRIECPDEPMAMGYGVLYTWSDAPTSLIFIPPAGMMMNSLVLATIDPESLRKLHANTERNRIVAQKFDRLRRDLERFAIRHGPCRIAEARDTPWWDRRADLPIYIDTNRPFAAHVSQRTKIGYLIDYMSDLSQQERDVLSLRFGCVISEPLTYEEIEQKLGIPVEKVRKLERQAKATIIRKMDLKRVAEGLLK